MLTVKLPGGGKRSKIPDGMPKVISQAAARAGIEPERMAYLMTYFLEEVVNAVCRGETVTARGFGQWHPWGYRGMKAARKGYAMICVPRFVASQGFKNEVITSAIPSMGINMRALNYRRNHTHNVDTPISSTRAHTALAQERTMWRKRMNTLPNKAG